MLDHLIRGASIVDGTGYRRPATSASAMGASSPSTRSHARAAHHLRRRRPRRVPRLRRSAHALRRPAVLGSPRVAVQRPRRHVGHRRQLQLRARAVAHADADYIAPMLSKVEGMPLAALEQGVPWGGRLRRLPRRVRRQHRRQRRFPPGHSRCAATCWAPTPTTHRDPGRARRCSPRSPTDGRGRARVLDRLSLRTATATAVRSRLVARRPTRCSRCARRPARHPGTTLAGIFEGASDGFTEAELDLLRQMSAAPTGR